MGTSQEVNQAKFFLQDFILIQIILFLYLMWIVYRCRTCKQISILSVLSRQKPCTYELLQDPHYLEALGRGGGHHQLIYYIFTYNTCNK